MRIMALAAFSLGYGRVSRLLICRRSYCFVAGVTENRLFLAEKYTANQTVGQVALVAAFIFYRGMDIALFQSFAQFRMAVEAFFSHCPLRFLVYLYA